MDALATNSFLKANETVPRVNTAIQECKNDIDIRTKFQFSSVPKIFMEKYNAKELLQQAYQILIESEQYNE